LPPRLGSEDGFTLAEVLLATALVAVIAVMVFGSLRLSTVAIDGARQSAAREQLLRSTLRIMAEELSTAVTVPIGPLIGVNATQDGQPADTIVFNTVGNSAPETPRRSRRWSAFSMRGNAIGFCGSSVATFTA
jgi:prepilin-type N-terminal cleavage/methylation domain-containing protein